MQLSLHSGGLLVENSMILLTRLVVKVSRKLGFASENKNVFYSEIFYISQLHPKYNLEPGNMNLQSVHNNRMISSVEKNIFLVKINTFINIKSKLIRSV